jgi:hypothetical protein
LEVLKPRTSKFTPVLNEIMPPAVVVTTVTGEPVGVKLMLIVSANAAGAIARAVAIASKARQSFFIVTSWSRPRGRFFCLSPLQRAGQRLNCSFNGRRVEVEQYPMLPALAPELPAHFQGRIASNLKSPRVTRLLGRRLQIQPSHQPCALLLMHIEGQRYGI